jgi:hypothetical protein
MTRPVVITWPLTSTTAVAKAQTLVAAGNLVLNGSLIAPGINIPPIVFNGITRTITLTSAANLSAVNFTITGYVNSAIVTEVLAGPNGNTVTSVNAYDSILSISASAGFSPNTVSAGTGQTGRTHWINFDYDILVPNYSIQVVVTGTINYTFGVTLDDVNTVTPTVFTPVVALTGATTSQLASLTAPINWMKITINSSDATGAIVATFLQQGLAS